MTHDSRLTTLFLLSVALLPLSCTRPPATPSTPESLNSPAPLPDCNAPPVAAQPEGCADEPPPADAGPIDRPGVDRDGDGIEDIFDACPDEPEDMDGDRDDDGCPDADATGETPASS